MIQYVMLDVDGVLISGIPHWNTDLKRDLGIDPTDLKTHFFQKYWRDVVTGNAELAETLGTALRQFSTDMSAQKLIKYWFEHDATIDQLMLDHCDILRSKGIKIYLTTNQDHARANYLMGDLKLADHVDGIIYSASLGTVKPNPDYYTKAMQITGGNMDEHVLIDDRIENIEAALNTGWRATLWDGSQTLLQVIDHL